MGPNNANPIPIPAKLATATSTADTPTATYECMGPGSGTASDTHKYLDPTTTASPSKYPDPDGQSGSTFSETWECATKCSPFYSTASPTANEFLHAWRKVIVTPHQSNGQRLGTSARHGLSFVDAGCYRERSRFVRQEAVSYGEVCRGFGHCAGSHCTGSSASPGSHCAGKQGKAHVALSLRTSSVEIFTQLQSSPYIKLQPHTVPFLPTRGH